MEEVFMLTKTDLVNLIETFLFDTDDAVTTEEYVDHYLAANKGN